MTNSNEIELKLAKLRENYKKILPKKITEIDELWKKLIAEKNLEALPLFHRKVHSLHVPFRQLCVTFPASNK